jgi:hypoxanthine phosphoribosyltransferase
MYQVAARHNPTDAVYTQATGRISLNLSALETALAGARLLGPVLLVDDICGTAATLDAVLPELTPHLAPGAVVRTAVLCRNTGAARDPDLWLWTVQDWVCFPWEPPPPPGMPVADLGPPSQRVYPR